MIQAGRGPLSVRQAGPKDAGDAFPNRFALYGPFCVSLVG